jgi:hypothetical protein
LTFCDISGPHGGEYEYELFRHVVWYIFTDDSEVIAASITVLMLEARSSSETLWTSIRPHVVTTQKTAIFLNNILSTEFWNLFPAPSERVANYGSRHQTSCLGVTAES